MIEARRAFPATARPLLDLLGPRPPWPDFFDSAAPDIEQALEEVRATPWTDLRADLSYAWADRPGRPPTWIRNLGDGDRESVDLVVRALRDLHKAVVAPRWDSVRVAFHADVAKRIPVLAAGGHEELFGTLHPRLRWRDDGLDRAGTNMVCDLRGDGLVLIPSAFWTGEPLFSVSDDERRPSSLLYAAAHANGHASACDVLLADPAAGDGLAALLGPTRAAVLRALAAPRGHGGAGRGGGHQPGLGLGARQGPARGVPDRDAQGRPRRAALADRARPHDARPAPDRGLPGRWLWRGLTSPPATSPAPGSARPPRRSSRRC